MEMHKYLKFDELDVDATTWVKEILQMINCQFVGQVSASSFTTRRNLTKDMLAEKLSRNIVNRQNEYINHLEKQCQNLKSDVIINQGAVIDLQKE